ncbi:hypothetical protein OGATHE_005195 [Ogataea polymorpha]|uniref:Uncharacterized protein n=1 Tax=Ogataea polymorpha TaxID=460523 RepID=A0A9P8NV37_9ASCO|nr:hypothetical protein OGATHE_005195 [Ogataea polymorpha]
MVSKLSVITFEFGSREFHISFIVCATDGLGSNLYLNSFGISLEASLLSLAINVSSLDLSNIAPRPKAIPFLDDHKAELLAMDINL